MYHKKRSNIKSAIRKECNSSLVRAHLLKNDHVAQKQTNTEQVNA